MGHMLFSHSFNWNNFNKKIIFHLLWLYYCYNFQYDNNKKERLYLEIKSRKNMGMKGVIAGCEDFKNEEKWGIYV